MIDPFIYYIFTDQLLTRKKEEMKGLVSALKKLIA